MRIIGVTLDQFVSIVERVSPKYGDNLCTNRDARNVSRRSMQGRLAVRSSRGPGARTSTSGRRMPAACWHAYRDVLSLLFEVYPTARVRTGLAAYNGRDGFYAAYPATAYRNIGSEWRPACMPELCECADGMPEGGTRPEPRAYVPFPQPKPQPEPGFVYWDGSGDAYEFRASDLSGH